MKREKWNRKTDLRNDPAESVSGAYEPEREYTLEEILSEFSGDRDSSGEQAWENEALPMSDFELDLFDRYESAAKPAAESEADSDLSPAAHIMEEESQITAEAVAPEAILTPEYTADPAEAGPEQIDYESITEEKTEQSDKPEPSGKAEKPEKAQKSGRERKTAAENRRSLKNFRICRRRKTRRSAAIWTIRRCFGCLRIRNRERPPRRVHRRLRKAEKQTGPQLP